MVDQVIYRCINAECGQPFPRQVPFCPYCGTGQHAGAAVHSVQSAAPAPVAAPAVVAAPIPIITAATAPEPQPVAKPVPKAVPVTATVFAGPASPPINRPIRKRYWVLTLLALWGIWHLTKPDGEDKFDARIGDAVALTAECHIDAARAELSALKSARATPGQLKRLQQAISDTAPACEKKRLHAKAWSDTNTEVERAVNAGAFAKAASRLSAFTQRWGDDAQTRALVNKLEQKQAEAWLDAADICLAKGDRICAELRLTAAERSKRPELSQRSTTLREELARLTESQMGKTADAEVLPRRRPKPESAPLR